MNIYRNHEVTRIGLGTLGELLQLLKSVQLKSDVYGASSSVIPVTVELILNTMTVYSSGVHK